MKFKKVTHVIFDQDGLLIESESAYNRVIGEIAQKFGKTYTHEVQLKIIGTPEPETARIAITELGLPITVDQFLSMYTERCSELLQNPPLLPGAAKLVQHFAKHKIPIAVATSSSQDLTDLKTKSHQDLYKLFHHVVCGSTDKEVVHGKPAPDIFLICASRFPDKPDPSQCLVFEDAPNGVQAACSAGMQVVMVPHSEVPDELKQSATLVLDSLEEFQPELFGLPPF